LFGGRVIKASLEMRKRRTCYAAGYLRGEEWGKKEGEVGN